MGATASTEQLVALLRHTLISNEAVAGIVGGRVHGAHLQDPDSRTVEYPLVILELEAGATSPSGTYQRQLVYVYAYHRASQGDAHKLYDAVHAALHHELLRRDGVSVAGYAMEQARPESGWNPQARAYYTRGLWLLQAAHRS